MSERELKPSVERATSAHGGADLAHALGRFAARAEAERLVDVAFAIADSPLGPLLVAATERGVVRLAYLDENVAREDVLGDLARRISPRVIEAPARLDEPRRQLDDYFGGRRAGLDLPVDLALVAPFAERVLGRTAAIPPGAVLTYGEVAAAIGSPRAARAVGNALGSNPVPIVVPCHRVVRGGGGLGGYTGGTHRKEHLLGLEHGGGYRPGTGR